MRRISRQKQEKLLFSFAITFLWGIIAHGYRFFNLDLSHDSLLVFQQLDTASMLSVGRFCQPVYFLFRGNTYPPALVGFLALSYLGAAVYWVADLLGWDSRKTIGLLSGVMTVNPAFTLTGASYLHVLDIYMLALLLAVGSVAALRKGKYIFSVLALVCSLGLYQSYWQAAAALHILLAILAILRREPTGRVLRDAGKAILFLIVSLLLYYALYFLTLTLTGMEASSGYNSLSQVGTEVSPRKILWDFLYSGYKVLDYFADPVASHKYLVMAANGSILVVTVWLLGKQARSRKIAGKPLILLAGLIALMPFAINFSCFLSGGMVHHLMMYACIFLYVLAMACDSKVVTALLAVVLLDGVIYSNQVYLKKALEANSTQATMNRILSRIEQTEGYTYGQTPVAFVGILYNSPNNRQAEDFDYNSTGLWHSYAVTFAQSYEMYIHNVLNYNMVLLSPEQTDALSQAEEVQAMGPFPAGNSVQMIGSVLVVKLAP